MQIRPKRKLIQSTDFFFSSRAKSASSELHSYAANLNQASVLPETMSELIAAAGSSFPATPVGFYSPPLTAEQQKTATSVCFFSQSLLQADGGMNVRSIKDSCLSDNSSRQCNPVITLSMN